MNVFDETARRLSEKRIKEEAEETEQTSELEAAAKNLHGELSASELLSARSDVKIKCCGPKVVLTAGTHQLLIEIRYPPSDRTYFVKRNGPPTHTMGAGQMAEAVIGWLAPAPKSA